MQDLRLTLLQVPLVWEDKAANRFAFDTRLAELDGPTDLVVLPEMFTTGFTMNPTPFAEPTDGETLLWMRRWAERLNAAVTGSFIVTGTDRPYNRLVFVYPDGRYLTYDKRHPFTMSGEHEQYARGGERLVVDYRGWRICPMICYDLRFPVWSRNTATDEYDLLLYVANWPNKRAYDWRTLLRARAIENQAYVAGVNRIGTDAYGHEYAGDSCVIDPGPRRDLLDIAGVEGAFTVELLYQHLQDVRRTLPFLRDRDDFSIHLGNRS